MRIHLYSLDSICTTAFLRFFFSNKNNYNQKNSVYTVSTKNISGFLLFFLK